MGAGFVSKVLDFIGAGNTDEDFEDMGYEHAENGMGKVVSINSAFSAKVVVTEPSAFEDMEQISTCLKKKNIVIADLKKLDSGLAQRCVDYICGSAYVLDGQIQQISPGIILLTPCNIKVSADGMF